MSIRVLGLGLENKDKDIKGTTKLMGTNHAMTLFSGQLPHQICPLSMCWESVGINYQYIKIDDYNHRSSIRFSINRKLHQIVVRQTTY